MTTMPAEWTVEKLALERLAQIKDGAAIDRQVKAYQTKLTEAHQARFGELDARECELVAVIEANPNWFASPKSRKTTSAQFGLVTGKGSLQVNDEEAVRAYGVEQGLPFVRVVEELDKDAIRAAVEAGEKVPGAEIAGKGNNGYVKLHKGLVDAIKANQATSGK